jgi:hypothetical protein
VRKSLEFIGFSAPSVLTVREFFSAVSGSCSAWISGSPHSVMHNPDRGSSSAYGRLREFFSVPKTALAGTAG